MIAPQIRAMLFLCLFLGICTPTPAQNKDIKVQQSWDGIISNEKLLKDAPPNGATRQGKAGFVADSKAWAKLWQSWRGKEPLPEVDFAADLVLVFTLGGPNKISVPELTLDEKGNLKAEAVATLIGGDGFCYKLVTVRRAGINSVNGASVPNAR